MVREQGIIMHDLTSYQQSVYRGMYTVTTLPIKALTVEQML